MILKPRKVRVDFCFQTRKVRQIMTRPSKLTCAALAAATLTAATPACAEDNSDLAKQLSNPVADLISVPFQYNYNSGLADGNGTQNYINIQPVIPIRLNDSWNIISRTILPVISLDGVPAGAGQTSGIGNITQSFFFSPKAPTRGGLVWGVGPVIQIPTSSDDALGAPQWGAGLTAVGLVQRKGWTFGMLVNHVWSLGKEDEYGEVSNTFFQPFVSYSTKKGMSVAMNTESTYDWIDKDWSVPVNLTVSQIIKIDKRPVQLTAGVRYWADSPEGAAQDWGARLAVTYLFPKK